MIRRTESYEPGARYLLQYAGRVERIAVARAEGDGVVLEPLPFQEPLPGRPIPGGEWLIQPGERLIRDGAGLHWSVTAAPAGRNVAPISSEVTFTRHLASGEHVVYRARSAHRADTLSDDQLLALLQQAWRGLDTDADERRRRTLAPLAAEL